MVYSINELNIQDIGNIQQIHLPAVTAMGRIDTNQ
jgi:hypothetical protein